MVANQYQQNITKKLHSHKFTQQIIFSSRASDIISYIYANFA